MFSILVNAALELEEIEGHVNREGLKAMYNLLWDNPNPNRRRQFRTKMKELAEENGIGGPQLALKHLVEMANLIGVEIVVMSHGPRGDTQSDAGWLQPKTKKKGKEAQNKGKEPYARERFSWKRLTFGSATGSWRWYCQAERNGFKPRT